MFRKTLSEGLYDLVEVSDGSPMIGELYVQQMVKLKGAAPLYPWQRVQASHSQY